MYPGRLPFFKPLPILFLFKQQTHVWCSIFPSENAPAEHLRGHHGNYQVASSCAWSWDCLQESQCGSILFLPGLIFSTVAYSVPIIYSIRSLSGLLHLMCPGSPSTERSIQWSAFILNLPLGNKKCRAYCGACFVISKVLRKQMGLHTQTDSVFFNLTLVEELFILFWLDPSGLFAKHLISRYCIYHQGRANTFLWLVNTVRRHGAKASWLSQTVAINPKPSKVPPSTYALIECPCPPASLGERRKVSRGWGYVYRGKGQPSRMPWGVVFFGIKRMRHSTVSQSFRVD